MSFLIFCKSFRNDIFRAKRLIESILKYNSEHIPFYLSIPQNDLEFFLKHIDFDSLNKKNSGKFYIIFDEDVVKSNPTAQIKKYYELNGYISQQVIKAEAWRYLECSNYLCIDSDCLFTKPFGLKNFIHQNGTPYTIMHDGQELLQPAEQANQKHVKRSYLQDSSRLKNEFKRSGLDYDFGPSPLIWSAKVWESLEKHLLFQGETIWDAFNRHPLEIRWYGETLLKYQPISVHPIAPLFTCYHYEWQFLNQASQALSHNLYGQTTEKIGIVIQSSWDISLQPSFARKSFTSRVWKKIKSFFKPL